MKCSRARLTPAKGSPLVAHAWQHLAASHGRRSVESLAQDTGWSRQYMADRFRAELGITPKTAARIFRFEHACGLISNLRLPLADVAAACGYADQAHMTRDWERLHRHFAQGLDRQRASISSRL